MLQKYSCKLGSPLPYAKSLLATTKQPFIEEEIKKATFSFGIDNTPGPDSFNAFLYRQFWYLEHDDLLDLFQSLYNKNLNLSQLNLVHVNLIPKKSGAYEPTDFRPISFLNKPYKIITKTLSNHFSIVIDQLVDPFQIAFLQKKSTLDSIAAAQKLIAACTKTKWAGLFLKLDFQKVFDSVDWPFLLKPLKSRGFDPK